MLSLFLLVLFNVIMDNRRDQSLLLSMMSFCFVLQIKMKTQPMMATRVFQRLNLASRELISSRCYNKTAPQSRPSSLFETRRRDYCNCIQKNKFRPLFRRKLGIAAVIFCHNYTLVALRELSAVTAIVVTVTASVPFSLLFSSQRALL